MFYLLYFLLALGALLFTQVLFALVNHGLFSVPDFVSWLRIVAGNLHFGISATAYFLSPFMVMFALPFRYRWRPGVQRAGRVLFLVLTGLMLVANLFDIPYYQFTLRRTTWEIFGYAGQNFSGGWGALIGQFLRDYWYYFLLFFVMEWLLWLGARRISLREPRGRYWVRQPLVMVAVLFLTLACMRGGFITQHKPLRAIDATRYADAGNTGLVVNTPFSLVRSVGHEGGLPNFQYYDSEQQLEQAFCPVQLPAADTCAYRRDDVQNVVLIILESFSEEYVGALNGTGRGWTPFLDSLVPHCLRFEGFANGKRSIESLPSLLSGIPSLMDEAFITSPYAQDRTLPLPELMRRHGFATAFFHGAYNGSMNFDSYCQSAGVDDYYGMDQYQSAQGDRNYGCGYAGFDGTWGIYDEPFLQFVSHQLSQYRRPFFATLYTISSHHPFAIPEPYRGRFPKGKEPILETVGYADHALRQFFHTASYQPWFRHTLFVITADHAAMPLSERYSTGVGRYRVPMLFYWPGADDAAPFVGEAGRTMQHVDLYPSLVDLMGWQDTVVGFGRSVFRPGEGYHVSYGESGYQLLRGGRVVQLQGDKVRRYRLSSDPLMRSPEPDDSLFSADQRLLQAILQQYSSRLKENRLQR